LQSQQRPSNQQVSLNLLSQWLKPNLLLKSNLSQSSQLNQFHRLSLLLVKVSPLRWKSLLTIL
jgi:hypothetical protein